MKIQEYARVHGDDLNFLKQRPILLTSYIMSKPILNIPAGNSTISEPISDEQLTGDKVTDLKKAFEVSQERTSLIRQSI